MFITHRLDIGTSGVFLIAKNKTFQKYFNHLLESHSVLKQYTALTTGSKIPPGKLIHWMHSHPRSPKILSAVPIDNWKKCEMNIVESNENFESSVNYSSCEQEAALNYQSQLMHDKLMKNQFAQNLITQQLITQKNKFQNPVIHENKKPINSYIIELITGRTHQIRAQLSFEGNPILGDSVYGASIQKSQFESHALHCHRLSFEYKGKKYDWSTPPLLI